SVAGRFRAAYKFRTTVSGVMRARGCATPIEVSDTSSDASKRILIFIFLSSRHLNSASSHESSRQRNLTARVCSRQGVQTWIHYAETNAANLSDSRQYVVHYTNPAFRRRA